MDYILTIDPAALDSKSNFSGVALFREKCLIWCQAFRGLPSSDYFNLPTELLIVIEMPVFYRNNKADPQDLLRLAYSAGAWSTIAKGRVQLVTPRQWKGQVPKKIMNNRIYNRLDSGEQSVVDTGSSTLAKRHNVLDSVGIGLHALGRLG